MCWNWFLSGTTTDDCVVEDRKYIDDLVSMNLVALSVDKCFGGVRKDCLMKLMIIRHIYAYLRCAVRSK
jgi:hypothetical protein